MLIVCDLLLFYKKQAAGLQGISPAILCFTMILLVVHFEGGIFYSYRNVL